MIWFGSVVFPLDLATTAATPRSTGEAARIVLVLGLGKYNREPSTEPKEPSTGTEKTGTEKFRFYFGSTF